MLQIQTGVLFERLAVVRSGKKKGAQKKLQTELLDVEKRRWLEFCLILPPHTPGVAKAAPTDPFRQTELLTLVMTVLEVLFEWSAALGSSESSGDPGNPRAGDHSN